MTRRDDRDGMPQSGPAPARSQGAVTIHPVPPKTFDPIRASRDEREHYGFPPEPNRGTQPLQYAFWRRLLSPPENGRLTFTAQRVDRLSPLLSCAASVPRRIVAPSRREQSLNWSGAYVTPKGGRSFTSVRGVWTVPALQPPPPSRPAEEYRISTWVGLDGQRSYLHSSLPQIGTAQVMGGCGKQEPTAWWQWWAHGQHNPIVPIELRVLPKQEIMAQIEVVDPHHVRFIIKNNTTGEIITPIVARAPQVYNDRPDRFEISGATAEWVVERPTRWDADELYELANYGRLRFSECLAVSPGFEQDLTGAKLISMFAARRDRNRKETLSSPELVGNRELDVVYHDLDTIYG